MATLRVENLGPFESVVIKIKPLTILVGKNSVGKSFLIYLLWALSSATPRFDKVEEEWDEYTRVAEVVVDKVARGENPREVIIQATRIFYENIFKRAAEIGLKERVEYAFGAELRDLIKRGKNRAVIELQGECGRFKATISETLRIEELDICLNRVLERLQVELSPRDRYVRVRYNNIERECAVFNLEDVTDNIIGLIAYSTATVFDELLFSTSELSLLLPDSRAGIARTILKPYSVVSMPLGVDAEYRDLYFRLVEWLYENQHVLEELKPLLEELSIALRPVFRAGVYDIDICSWAGKCSPLSLAPSGVREILSVVLALAFRATRQVPINVFIEEPEAHLHSRALKFLAKLIARAINGGKRVFITTHSDYLVGYMSNLIIASKLTHDKLVKLSYEEKEVLKPEMIAVYLVKALDDKAVIEPIEVTGEGISEEEFGKIAEELLGERGKIYAEL